MKYVEENMGDRFYIINIKHIFCDSTPMTKELKTNRWDYLKLESERKEDWKDIMLNGIKYTVYTE